jgi:HD-GYP domain-containing protein (c-di-GMP phosphodiesterase class II)
MSSAEPSGGPSPAPEQAGHIAEAALVKVRGVALLEGLERHVPGSTEHAEATASYALAAAAELGFGRRRAELLREVAKLHEIGRVYLPAELLSKPLDELAPAERAGLDRHYLAGAQLAAGAGIPADACEWIRAVGERFDGNGPGGLAGDAIPPEARVIRAACACDALVRAPADPGSVASGLDPRARAAAGLRSAAGAELDPAPALALAAVLGRAA